MSDMPFADAGASGLVTPPVRDQPRGAAWNAVISLSLGVFGLATAEFLPATVLTPMATDLGVSAGAAGQAVTMTAAVAAIAGRRS